jgi:cyclohexyl-isocyanide hydratase
MRVIAKTRNPVRDMKGLILTPEVTIAEAPELDLLLVPGGFGQQDLMDDEEVLALIRNHADSGGLVFSVCTGALLCGAARRCSPIRSRIFAKSISARRPQ